MPLVALRRGRNLLDKTIFEGLGKLFHEKSFPLTLPEMLFHLRKYSGEIFAEAVS